MKLMHTRLPDFYKKLHEASKRYREDVELTITGMENIKTAKLASASLGIMQDDIASLTQDPDLERVEVTVLGQIPATIHTVVVKGIQKDGTSKLTYLDSLYISAPGPEYYCHDSEKIVDHRVPFD